MPLTVVADELHVTVRMPADLPAAEAEAVRRTLADPTFADRLQDAIVATVREFQALARVTVTLTR